MARISSAQWYLVYVAIVVVGGFYCMYYTTWGGKAFGIVSLLLLIYGVCVALYSLLRLVASRLRNRSSTKPEVSSTPPHQV